MYALRSYHVPLLRCYTCYGCSSHICTILCVVVVQLWFVVLLHVTNPFVSMHASSHHGEDIFPHFLALLSGPLSFLLPKVSLPHHPHEVHDKTIPCILKREKIALASFLVPVHASCSTKPLFFYEYKSCLYIVLATKKIVPL